MVVVNVVVVVVVRRVASKALRKLEHVRFLPPSHLATWKAMRDSSLLASRAALIELGLFVLLAVVTPLYLVSVGWLEVFLMPMAMFRGLMGLREAAEHVFHLVFGLFATAADRKSVV